MKKIGLIGLRLFWICGNCNHLQGWFFISAVLVTHIMLIICERGLIQEMPDINKDKTCCFFGHRKIDETAELKDKLCGIIENLIVNEKVDTFLFGSKSQFDDWCHKVLTELKEKYPHIKRIYVRSAYQHIPEWYEDSLLKHYEVTYFPEHMENADKAFM